MGKKLMYGNHALGEAAILGGCQCYFGYPITPQNELTEYMAQNMPRVPDGVFIQSESEIAAINMVLGASVAGKRAMTSSSSPGISLKQEGISFLAASELPAVIVNVVRGGPGLGNIAPAQSDYFQATRGGGHGDYRTIVLAPASVQEMADFTMDAFDLADIYRTPVMILTDGLIGQMMEPVVFKKPGTKKLPPKDWILDGAEGRTSRFIRSLILDVFLEEEHNWKLQRKYTLIQNKEVRVEISNMDDAKLAIVAYGTAARIAKGAVKNARKQGLKVGLFRPQTLWPFPVKEIREVAWSVKHFLVFEMSCGQMIEDVQLSLQGKSNISFYGRPGGVVITPSDLITHIQREYHKI
ncbi:MAG: 3-methyl-2-oxobutanoate dehydrogenase subunit VorB [Deltaproteobacteria bacterium]|nr:3-methyl-2-oxobutanoate dehydrogenase subunit VorB [Deltaproteobacteria bacterium]